MISKLIRSIQTVRRAINDKTPERLLRELSAEHDAIKKHMSESNPYITNYCSIRHDSCRSCGLLVWEKDKQHRYIAANDVHLRIFHQLEPFDIHHVIGKTDIELIDEWRERTGKENTFGEICVSTDQWIMDNFSSGRFFEFGYRDGTPLLLDVCKKPIIIDGVFSGTQGNALDLSNKESDAYELLHHFIKIGLAKRLPVGDRPDVAVYLINDRRKTFNRKFP